MSLEENLAIARAVMDASADGILLVTDQGMKSVALNRRFLEMLDIPEEMGQKGDLQRIVDFISPQMEDVGLFRRSTIDQACDSSAPERRDLLRMKNGRVLECISLPFFIAGKAAGRITTLRDLTLHHEALLALSRARDEALEAERLKMSFLANVSHELRTPLNAVVGSAGLLRATGLSPAQLEYIEVISAAVNNLLETVEGILDFSKIEAGRMTIESTPLRIGPILAAAAALVAPAASAKNLRLQVDPGESSCEEFLGDPTRLRQILINLLSNAVKFTQSGCVEVGVRVLSRRGSSTELEFSVLDTGIGITPEQGARLFTPFTQADSTMTRRFGGTGLGLAICKSLVELMGGKIGFESAQERGSRFWFRLTLERAPLSAESPLAPSAAPLPVQGPRERVRVLVVEDNETNRRLLVRQMQQLGCGVEAVGDGEEAVTRTRGEDFGLVLMDCQMPGTDGLETTRRMRLTESGQRHVPIIAVSANATEKDRRHCLEAGMDDFVSKPVTLETLAAALDRWDRPFDEPSLSRFAVLTADSPEACARLLDEFLADARESFAAARRALDRGENEVCARAAHTVKGAAAAVGARGLRELSRLLERAASQGEPRERLLCLLDQAAAEASRAAADVALRRPS